MSNPVKTVTPIRPGIFPNIGRHSAGRLAFCAFCGLCLFLILCHSDTAVSYMSQGLSLCAEMVIPSLFPFMVLSELLVESGGGEILGKLWERPLRRLFGISGAGVCALMMGLVCGFPVGTKTAVSLCRRGDISPEELSRLICFCNIPSSAFLINAVGVSLFGNRRFGLISYVICLLAALLTARILHLFSPLPPKEERPRKAALTSGVQIFTHAVTSAALAMLYVCAYVVFFSAFIGTLGHLLRGVASGPLFTALLFGLFELSGGVMQASAIPDPTMAQMVTLILCGWSGLSVHLQILSLCDDLPSGASVRVRPYLLCKLIQVLLCALLFGIAALCLPEDFFRSTQSVVTFAITTDIHHQIVPFFNAAFGSSLFLAAVQLIKAKTAPRFSKRL